MLFLAFMALAGCHSSNRVEMEKIIFLHHSTGQAVWLGSTNRYVYRLTRKGDVQKYFDRYNRSHKTAYQISDMKFPQALPYGGRNYPYDYYNIWVKNAGVHPYMEQPTLEMLTKEYDVIVFKHCFPVGFIQEDTGYPNVDSEEKRLENYYLQYGALKQKMHAFPNNIFIVWTPPALLKKATTEEQAKRTHDFYQWVMDEWNEKGDNIHVWDFYGYETEGDVYMNEAFALGSGDSHPNAGFAAQMAPLFARFMIDCMEGRVD